MKCHNCDVHLRPQSELNHDDKLLLRHVFSSLMNSNVCDCIVSDHTSYFTFSSPTFRCEVNVWQPEVEIADRVTSLTIVSRALNVHIQPSTSAGGYTYSMNDQGARELDFVPIEPLFEHLNRIVTQLKLRLCQHE
jgi:hypothetical protein